MRNVIGGWKGIHSAYAPAHVLLLPSSSRPLPSWDLAEILAVIATLLAEILAVITTLLADS